MNPPCKNCKDRTVGCHGKCEAYQALDKERKKINAEKMEKSYYAERGSKVCARMALARQRAERLGR